jgi:hypothetical protein
MHDFLSRLSARTLGIAPAVRPRTSTLFDPSPNEGPSLPTAAITPSEVTSVADTWPREAARSAAAVHHTDPSREVRRAAFDPPALIVRSPASAIASAIIPAISATPAPYQTSAKPNEIPAGVHTDAPQPLVQQPSRTRRPSNVQKSQPVSVIPKSDRVARYESRNGELAHHLNLKHSDEPPTIRVTIGRVEVLQTAQAKQATQPMQSTQRPPPAASKMVSLDDYLKRGSRG